VDRSGVDATSPATSTKSNVKVAVTLATDLESAKEALAAPKSKEFGLPKRDETYWLRETSSNVVGFSCLTIILVLLGAYHDRQPPTGRH
jgi:hypothetical protein